MSEAAITPLDRRRLETASSQEFGDSLRLLERNTSWILWSSVLSLPILLGASILFSFPALLAQFSLSRELSAKWLASGLLGLLFGMNIITLNRQRHFKTVRKLVISQMDAATKQRVKAERYYGLSILDALTGLYNRRFGETRLLEEIGRAEKSGEPLLVLALDFDGFKGINDRYGHAAGDLALKTFARRLQRAIRACDVPIRVGGDEFLVILPECSADKVQMILSRTHPVEVKLDGQRFLVCFSHGMAQYQAKDTPETMIKRADERLYEAKAQCASVEV